jgi:hypothetical protein
MGLLSVLDTAPTEKAIRHAAEWLRLRQRDDGAVGLSPSLPGSTWATPHAILFWNALSFDAGARRAAVEWLLAARGKPVDATPSERHEVVGHDTTLIGWPWIIDTHSWLEPTAMAVLAICREGLEEHPRVLEGRKLILDRTLHHGGWNYGNPLVFGRELRPQPGPTGQALMALAATDAGRHLHCVDLAISYLKRILPETLAPISLAWGVLGLHAWGACPADSASWLAKSFATHRLDKDVTVGLGLLLLAIAGRLPANPGPST